MTVNHSLTMAIRMASRADVERIETYRSNIEYYRENNYSYIPLPTDGLYYDTETDELRELHPLQFVAEDMPVINTFEHLLYHPFLIINSSLIYYTTPDGVTTQTSTAGFDDGINLMDYGWPEVKSEVEALHSFREALERHPDERDKIIDIWEENSRYHIITLADVNKRQAKEAVYPIIAGLEIALASELKNHYSNNYEELIDKASKGAYNYWKNDKESGVELHITEYMSLGEIRDLVSREKAIYTKFGFSDANSLIEELSGINNKFRDRIMHTPKTLVQNTTELEELVTELETAERIIKASGDGVSGRDYGRYERRRDRRQ